MLILYFLFVPVFLLTGQLITERQETGGTIFLFFIPFLLVVIVFFRPAYLFSQKACKFIKSPKADYDKGGFTY